MSDSHIILIQLVTIVTYKKQDIIGPRTPSNALKNYMYYIYIYYNMNFHLKITTSICNRKP